MSAYHVSAHCQQRPEEGAGYYRIGVTIVRCYVGAGKRTWSSGRAAVLLTTEPHLWFIAFCFVVVAIVLSFSFL